MHLFWPIVACLVALAVYPIVSLLYSAGQFGTYPSHGLRDCEVYGDIPGPEDIVVDRERHVAYVAGDPRLVWGAGGASHPSYVTEQQGAIYRYDLSVPRKDRVPVKMDLRNYTAPDFHPHGIDFYPATAVSSGGHPRLFVVNHRMDGDHVEIFDVHEDHLALVDSHSGKLYLSLNDVVAVSPDEFYATIDRAIERNFFRIVQQIYGFPYGFVLHHSRERGTRLVLRGSAYPNGIQRSRDGRKIYVAAMTGLTIQEYDRQEDGSLKLAGGLHTGVYMDNIEVDPEDGSLYVAAVRRPLDWFLFVAGIYRSAPSQVIRIPVDGSGSILRSDEVEEVLYSEGSSMPHYSANSVATPYYDELLKERRIFLGSAIIDSFANCAMPSAEEFVKFRGSLLLPNSESA